MAAELLSSVGFTWDRHPHRLHTLQIGRRIPDGIDVRGGPWTTGKRSTDTIIPHVEWAEHDHIDAEPLALTPRQGEGERQAEVRWLLEPELTAPVAVVGVRLTSLSHPSGFNLAGFSVGVDGFGSAPRRAAWCRIEAEAVPDRPEKFDRVVIEAELDLLALSAVGDGPPVVVEHLRRRQHTAPGFRPQHRPVRLLGHGHGTPLGLAGWSWRVDNTQRARGRYLRTWRTSVLEGGQVEMMVSNRGEVTRATDLTLEASVVVR